MQHKGPLLSIIVPTFNEADNVRHLVEQLVVLLEGIDWEVIFVDDDSPDGTASVVRQIGREQAQVRCVQRIGRRGLSTACIEGMLASNAPFLAVMDCDLQHDPALVHRMLEILAAGEAEIAIGSRYVEGGSCGNWSKRRLRISRFATFLSKFLLLDDLKDPMSNFFALRRDLFDEVMHGLSGLSFKILLDILLTARRPVRLREIPFVLAERTTGESKFEVVVAWEFTMLLADKTVGRYIPVRFIALAIGGVVVAATHLSIFVIAYRICGLGFIFSQAVAATLSMVVSYTVGNLVKYGAYRKHGLGWIGGLVSFLSACSIGAAVNVAVAAYLFERGLSWFLASAAGVLLWLAWNFTATSSHVWSLGIGRVQRLPKAPKWSRRYGQGRVFDTGSTFLW